MSVVSCVWKTTRAVTTTTATRGFRALPRQACAQFGWALQQAPHRRFSDSSKATTPQQPVVAASDIAENSETEDKMAWRCSGSTNDELVSHLEETGLVHTPAIIAAMRATDRAHYVPTKAAHLAYNDSPVPVGYAATISAPHMHAMCLELMQKQLAKPGCKCLDVGSGSGYLTAVFGRLVRDQGGSSYGVEHIRELVDWSIANVRRDDPDLLQVVKMVHADGRLGLPAHATYDCIHVGAASPSLPVALMEQLNVGGRLVVPEGPEGEMQYLNVYDKVSDDPDAPNHGVKKCKATAVRYVPLTDESSQRGQSW